MYEKHDDFYSFNPRSRTRSDNKKDFSLGWRIVSIHAPVQGATVMDIFYPVMMEFQSTLPYKERLA